MLDEVSRRKMFPTLDGKVYLNTAAEGIPPLVVRDALLQYFHDHQMGMEGRDAHFVQWEAAKALTARAFGLTAPEVSICSCSSEAYNLIAMALRLQPGDEVVINDLDFPAGATPWLQESCPAATRLWRARDGALRVEDLVPLLGPKTRIVTVSLVSFFNGFMVPLRQVVQTVHQRSPAVLAVDVTQALGRIALDLTDVDVIVSSTHKWILSSHGGGLIGVRNDGRANWKVPAGGWFHLEDAFGPHRFERAVSKPGAAGFTVGMPNFPAVYAIRAALDYILGIGPDAIDKAARPLVLACINELAKLPVQLITPNESSALAGIIAFRHPDSDQIHQHLRRHNVHVMSQTGRLRVAIHGYNTSKDVDTFLAILQEAVNHVGAR